MCCKLLIYSVRLLHCTPGTAAAGHRSTIRLDEAVGRRKDKVKMMALAIASRTETAGNQI